MFPKLWSQGLEDFLTQTKNFFLMNKNHLTTSPYQPLPTCPRIQLVHLPLLRQLRTPKAHGEAQGTPALCAQVAGRLLGSEGGAVTVKPEKKSI